MNYSDNESNNEVVGYIDIALRHLGENAEFC